MVSTRLLDRNAGGIELVGLRAPCRLRPLPVRLQRQVGAAVPELSLNPLRVQATLEADPVERRTQRMERLPRPSALARLRDRRLRLLHRFQYELREPLRIHAAAPGCPEQRPLVQPALRDPRFKYRPCRR